MPDPFCYLLTKGTAAWKFNEHGFCYIKAPEPCLGIDRGKGDLCTSVSGNCTGVRLPFAPGVGSGR